MARSKAMRNRLIFVVLTWCAFQYGAFAPAAARAASHNIVMEAMAFVPPKLTVKRGDTVVWINKDLFAHTASAGDRSFDSGEMAPDKRWSFVAGKRGTFPYVCTFHPSMTGSATLQ